MPLNYVMPKKLLLIRSQKILNEVYSNKKGQL